MALARRVISAVFDLADSGFSDGGNRLAVDGLSCDVSINNMSGDSLNSLQFRIFGMKEADMNRISTLGVRPTTFSRNRITVAAGDSLKGLSQIFQGTIVSAYADYRGMPEVSLNVEAMAGFYEQVKAVAINSYKGPTDVASVIKSLAESIGFAFTNNGVNVKLSSPYFAGSAVSQIKACANAAGIAYDISNGAVQIWNSGDSKDNLEFQLGPGSGLVGYPVFSKVGVDIQCEFNPDIQNGRLINLDSSIPQARGRWHALTVRHELSSETPNGPWFTYAQLVREGVYAKGRG